MLVRDFTLQSLVLPFPLFAVDALQMSFHLKRAYSQGYFVANLEPFYLDFPALISELPYRKSIYAGRSAVMQDAFAGYDRS
jgi:hypothetical protein